MQKSWKIAILISLTINLVFVLLLTQTRQQVQRLNEQVVLQSYQISATDNYVDQIREQIDY